MVEYPHALTECEECGAHYCMGCVGEECPSCKLQEVAFYAIELEEKLKGFKIDAKVMSRKLKAVEDWGKILGKEAS